MKETELNGNNETHTNLRQLIYCYGSYGTKLYLIIINYT